MLAKLLIVDDEPSIADNLCYALTTEGYDVSWAKTIEEANSEYNSKHFDLIVLDVNLPDGSGFEFCKQVRAGSDIPIIFLTSRGSELDRVVGLEIGGDDYVVKPFSPRELTARVKNILRRINKQRETIEGSAGQNRLFEVDDERKQIRLKGKALDLSRYEYGLLKTLIRRPGRVYSRDELMTLVWDEPESSFDRTVDAHIKNIRLKLKEVMSDSNIIITHRGMGYSFSEKFR